VKSWPTPGRAAIDCRRALLFVSCALSAASIRAETTEALAEITVVATGVSNLTAASAGDISQADLAGQPLLRPGAILENVPGLIVTQHSGEGKANQYFLRAFNLDHGTDLAIEVDDMPVNLPTHAHGQGYSDLNFLIPELVADLHYKKGPYYADEGDFATAGAIRMDLLSEVAPSVTAGVGEDGYRRGLLMGSMSLGPGSLLAAVDLYHNDGPFQRPDDFNRQNGELRYHQGNATDYFTVTALGYHGRWNATDQVPLRAITEGLIDRFGTLAPSDGGISSRYSLSFDRVRRSDDDQVQLSAYLIKYRLDLYSTFTYDLVDPVNGDQMLQHDDRLVYGLKASKSWFGSVAGRDTSTVIGIQTRFDDIKDIGLYHTLERQVIGTDQHAAVRETNGALYVENTTRWLDKLNVALGAREDVFDFDVTDRMRSAQGVCSLASDPLGCDSGHRRANLFSPKLGLTLGPWQQTSLFLTVAEGYHSNDARGVTRSGENPEAAPATPLTRARSAEIGVATDYWPRWHTSVDVFLLKLKSELVFAGDAGTTEPSGSTTRQGIEWGNTLKINEWLHADLNAAFSRGRFDRDVAPDDTGCGEAAAGTTCVKTPLISGRYIPNSPSNVVDAGITAQHPSGWFGALRARHFGASPLVEDNSAKSAAYTTVDLQLGYTESQRWRVALDVFNLLDKRWDDIEYYYASRLQGEAAARPDYVVHPGVPRTLRANFQYFL
jgi:outer membrane receptor protein involved in Fe transport